MNLFHHSSAFIAKHLPSLKLWRAKHKRHHHLIIALLVITVAGVGGVSLYKKIAKAATFSFTQASWAGGATANTAVHPTNQSSWTQYASSTGVTAGTTVVLPSTGYAFTDDGATSTVPTASTSGGTFGAGTNSSTVVSGSGTGASVGLSIGGGDGTNGAYSCASGTCNLAGATYNYTTFNISSGATVNVTGTNALIIKATGNVTIAGTLNLNGGNGGNGYNAGGVAGPGGYAGGSYSYQIDTCYDNYGAPYDCNGHYVFTNAGGPGGGSSSLLSFKVGGGGGASAANGSTNIICSGASAGVAYSTETGGSGGGSSSGSSSGGGGGGYLKIISNGIFTNSGTINAYGGTGGGSSNWYWGGGGGGGGGRINVIASTIINSGTINANGGGGGTGGGYSADTGGGGGGGGGGGRIILQDSDGIVSGGSIFASGGTMGLTTNSNCGAIPGGTPSPVYTQSALTYPSTGTFTSVAIGLGAPSGFTGKTLTWSETLPSGTDIQIQMRSASTQGGLSSATWYGPTGTGDWYTASGSNINTTAHNGAQWIQYKAVLTSPSPYTATPLLNSVTINYTQIPASGNLISSKYDTGSEALVSKLTWAGTGTTTTETIKFQMRSSADGNTWTNWCGDSTCDASETDYFENANNGVTITSGHPLRSGTGSNADRYFQYKVFLGSGGGATPTLTSVTVQYVVNGPPAVGNILPEQITDSASANYGKVSFSFEASDSDTTTGATQNIVTPTLYEYYNGSSWATISSGLSANAYSAISLSADSATTTTTVVWTPTAGIPLTNGAKIRVTITDGEAANFSAVATSGTFSLDSTAPVVASTGGFLVDSSVGGAGLAGIKLAATDDSTMQYRLCNNADFSADGLNLGAGKCAEWSTLASSPVALATTTTSWITVLTASSTEVVYMQVRDLYGNVTALTATALAMPVNLLAADVSNPAASSFGETLSWLSVANASSYKVYYATTTSATVAPSSYTLLASPSTNVYQHTIPTTATSSAYWYRVAAVNANGDISNFTTEMTEGDVPDSFGTDLPDTTPPVISSISAPAASLRSTSAVVTFTTNELATATVIYGTTYSASCSYGSTVSTTHYVTAQSVSVTGLAPGTTYYFCVKATDTLGNMSNANDATLVGGTLATVGGPTISSVSTQNLAGNSVTITWNTATSSDSYIYYSTSNTLLNPITKGSTDMVTCASQGVCQHQVGLTGLTAGTAYYYKVKSTDTDDNAVTDTNSGSYHSFTTLQDTTPPTITGTSTPVLAPTASVIVWQTDEPATSKVDYGTESGVYGKGVVEDTTLSIYHVMTLSSATSNALGSGDNALVKETPYYYRVTSKDAANNSATATGTFTTPDDGNVTITMISVRSSADGEVKDTTAPSISNVTVSDITPFSAVVKFDTSEVAVSFVDYGKDTSYGDSAGDKVYGTTHAVKLRGLSLGTEYHINVTAHDKAGNTGTGSDQTFKTTFLSENLKDMTKIENIEQFQKEIEDTIESILPSLVPPFVSKPVVTDITENGAIVSFRTNIKSFPVVGFVEDALYDATKENPYTGEVSDMTEKSLDHTVALIGLKQNTKYRVQARAFSLPKVIGKSADISFTTKASKIVGSIIERKKDSFTVVWTTDEPTSSIVEYKNTASGVTERKTDDAKRTSHSMRIDNLPSGTTYAVDISGLNEAGNVVEAGASLTVTTSRDVTPPVISGFKVDNALVPGRTDRIQTIVSWKTDEPANSTTYYEEGAGTAGDTKELINKNEVLDSYVTAHSVILPNLKPGTIYRLKVTSSDDSGNEASFGPRTVITPRQTESITDIIFKNFEDSFKFLRDI